MSESNEPEQHLIRRIENSVVWIVLNRPNSGNAMTAGMRETMCAWLEDASADLTVRAVVITAMGERAFCTGPDLGANRTKLRERPNDAPERAMGDTSRMIRNGWQRLIAAILDCEKPVIAGVNGTAAGAGAHLAFACDLIVAVEQSKFLEVFVRRGIAPDAGGAWLLTRLIGIQKTKELFFFGHDLPASDARGLGLVNRVVPRHELETTLRSLAAQLAEGPTKAIGVAKRLANRALDVDRSTAFLEEAHAQELVTTTEDAREGLASFVEGRPPKFKGW